MTSKTTVWIVNHYAAIETKDGWEGRHQSLASYLAKVGWHPVLFLASTGHPIGNQHFRGRQQRSIALHNGVVQVMLRSSRYMGSGLKRILNMLIFTLQILLPWNTRGLTKPDVVIGSTVHPLAAWSGLILARRHKVPFVFEIRDVWPDALIHLGLLKPGSIPALLMKKLMVHLLREAELVLSPLPGVNDYMKQHGAESTPFLWISNGAEGTNSRFEDRHSDGNDEFVFMYLGSFGNAMAVEYLIDAFEKVCVQRPATSLKFRLIGDGPKRTTFERQARESRASNCIIFEPRIPREMVVERASEADCLLHSLHNHHVYQYGISPNKLFDYLLSARPVVFATNTYRNPISEAGAGIVVAAEQTDEIVDAMIEILDMSQEQRIMLGRQGRDHLLEHYTYEALAGKLSDALRKLLTNSGV